MQSPPGGEQLQITFAVKGAYTKRMASELSPGSQVTLKLPFGNLFTQEHNKENTVFIAGGTGITPFLSLFNDSTFAEYENAVLLAGFRNRQMHLYREELERAKELNGSFSVKLYFEDEAGLIDLNDIKTAMVDHSTFFISGPPAMIAHFKNTLKEAGIDERQILTDDWE